MTMTIPALIARYGIEDAGVQPNGERSLRLTRNIKEATAQKAAIVGAKAAILAELDRRRDAAAAAKAQREAAIAARRHALETNQAPFAIRWQEGAVLSGWTASGPDAAVLKALGVARDVRGWGTLVDTKLVAALGDTFTVAEVERYTAPARTQAAAAQAAEAARVAAAHTEATTSGHPVVLRHTTVPCNNSREECSLDLLYTEVHPDGSIRERRVHTCNEGATLGLVPAMSGYAVGEEY